MLENPDAAGSEEWVETVHRVLRSKKSLPVEKDRAKSAVRAWIQRLIACDPFGYTKRPALAHLLRPMPVYEALLPAWEEAVRKVQRGYRYPSVPELCEMADLTGMHPVLSRRFENHHRQALADVRNNDVLRDLVGMDGRFLPFLCPIRVIFAVFDPPPSVPYTVQSQQPSDARRFVAENHNLRWRLLVRSVEDTARVPAVLENLASTVYAARLTRALLLDGPVRCAKDLLCAMERRGLGRFLAAAGQYIGDHHHEIGEELRQRGVGDGAYDTDRWNLFSHLLTHASSADAAADGGERLALIP
jgi:hypothetical protein